VQPHRNKYWLFPKIDDQEAWNAQVVEICTVYREALELYRTSGLARTLGYLGSLSGLALCRIVL